MSQFREKFTLAVKLEKWFPGHMRKGFLQMGRTLKRVDCILEVHDCRIPISGRNTSFVKSLATSKPHILILTKTDLVDLSYKYLIMDKLHKSGIDKVIFLDSKQTNDSINGYSEILPSVIPMIKNSERFNREDAYSYDLMIMGIPNVGKSTVINRLRSMNLRISGKAARVGAIAGITRSVMERIKINTNPPVYLYDTPGVIEPKLNKGIETIMKCALCATLSDEVIGIRHIADYALYWLNKHGNFSYVDHCGIDHPTDNITELLVKASVRWNYIEEIRDLERNLTKRPLLDQTAIRFVKAFRDGLFGRVLLDDDIL